MSLLLSLTLAAGTALSASAPSYSVGPAQTRIIYISASDDFVPQQAPSFVSDQDENAWQFRVPARRQAPRVQSFQYEDWIVEQVAPPSGEVADSAAPRYAVGTSKATVIYVAGDEGLPSQPLDSGDGLVWLSIAPPYKAPLTPFIAEDFPPIAGPVVVPVGASEQPAYSIGQSKITVRYVYGDEQIAVTLGIAFEEEGWTGRVPRTALPKFVPLWLSDDLFPVAPSIAFEEEGWSGWFPKIRLPRIIPHWFIQDAERLLFAVHDATAFTGELSVLPRFIGILSITPQFSGLGTLAPRFIGVVDTSPQFAGDASVTPLLDGELEVRPD